MAHSMKNMMEMISELKDKVDSLYKYMEEYEGMDYEDDEGMDEEEYPEEETADEDYEDEAPADEDEGAKERGAMNKKPIAAIVLALKKKKGKG